MQGLLQNKLFLQYIDMIPINYIYAVGKVHFVTAP